MKTGDLVRYNACGQRNKTMGMVLKVDHERGLVCIVWHVLGDVMPRLSWIMMAEDPGGVKRGVPAWHPNADYFEIVHQV